MELKTISAGQKRGMAYAFSEVLELQLRSGYRID